MSKLLTSSLFRYRSTFLINSESWARFSLSQKITGTPVAGALAYLDDDTAGNLTVKANVDDGEYIPIGRFMSTKDEDDYVKVEINLPAGVMNTDAGALE